LSRLYSFVVVLCLMAACINHALAQTVHRCEQNGQTIYSQFPCEQKQKAKQLDIKTADLPSNQLVSNLVWKTYDVDGKDYSSLIRSLAVNGPKANDKSFHGLARWRVGYKYETKPAGQKCKFSAITLSIDGEILMPLWREESSAPQELRQRWTRYHAALKAHEEGHIQHGRELALRLREQFLGLGDFECGEVAALAQREFDRIYANLKNRDQEYDQRTRHGATQGAFFD
jgi:predicted secreted Zn-dependent protease